MSFLNIRSTASKRASGIRAGIGRVPVKWKVMGVIFLLIIALGVYKTVEARRNKDVVPVRTVKVREQELTSNIYTTGTLAATGLKEYYAKGTTSVAEIKKKAGEKVFAGEPVIILDNSQALLDLGQAESALALQEVQYRQAVSDKGLWEQKLEEAKKNVERMTKLYELGGVSLQELENARLETAGAQSQLSGIDLKAQEAQVKKAALAVNAAQEALEATVITSPLDGILLKVGVKEGQPVTPGMFLASFGDVNKLEAVCSINEYDALKVKEGQPAEIFSEGKREKKYKGHVARIAPQAEMEQTSMGQENRVKLEISLDEEVEDLKPGYSVNVWILTDKRPQTLVVPIEAVVEKDDKNVVFVLKEGSAELREVQKGLSNELYQEITAGLEADETVIISSLDKLQDKTKVKANDNNSRLN